MADMRAAAVTASPRTRPCRTCGSAVVVSQNRQRRLKPRVMLILDEAKQSYGRPRMIDLMLDPLTQTGTMYTISQALSADAYDMSAAAESVVGIR